MPRSARAETPRVPERAFHFISGLPRAGSTLTAAILRQNPRFHAGMSSPIASLFDNVIAQVSAGSELSTMVNEAQRASPSPPPELKHWSRAWHAVTSLLQRIEHSCQTSEMTKNDRAFIA